MEKTRLSPSAIPAAIILMISALVCFFVLRLPVDHPDPFQMFATLLLFPLGFLLFFRRRFLAIGILLCVLSLGSFAGMLYWGNVDAQLPLFIVHGVRSVVFFAAALACFRRLRCGRRGAWWLGTAIGLFCCVYLLINGAEMSQSAFLGEATVGSLCLLLAFADMLLYIGVFLLTLAFARPLGRQVEAVPSPAPVRTGPGTEGETLRPQERQPQPASGPARPPIYTEAEYEILPDEDEK